MTVPYLVSSTYDLIYVFATAAHDMSAGVKQIRLEKSALPVRTFSFDRHLRVQPQEAQAVSVLTNRNPSQERRMRFHQQPTIRI